jgi:hypothetical protein
MYDSMDAQLHVENKGSGEHQTWPDPGTASDILMDRICDSYPGIKKCHNWNIM